MPRSAERIPAMGAPAAYPTRQLGDLGVSRVMDEEDHVLTTLIGTPLYLRWAATAGARSFPQSPPPR